MRASGTRRQLTPFFLLTAVMSLGYGSIYTLLGEIRDRFGLESWHVGLIAFAGFATGFTAQVFLARYADRGHSVVMVRAGIAAAALGMGWMIIATDLWQWVCARLLLGLGSGMVGPAVRRIVIARDPANVGANLGRQASFDVGGFVLGPIVAAVLAEAVGLRAPFVFLALLDVAVLVVTWRIHLDAGTAGAQRAVLRGLLARPAMQAALFASIAFYVTIGMFEALWSVLLTDLGAQTWVIGLTLTLFTVPMMFLAPLGGRLAQRRGPMRVVLFSILVAALCTMSYGLFPLWIVLAVSIVHAVADSFTMPGNQVAVALSSPPDQLAAGQGLLGAVGLAVAGLVALIGGAVYDAAGRAALFVATSVVMIGFWALAAWRGRDLLASQPPTVAPAAVS